MRRAPLIAKGATAAVIVLLGATGCTSDGDADTPAAGPEPTATANGWRTESFGDVELSVPSTWGHQSGDIAAALWCISDAAVSGPVVIRPGLPVEATCPGAEDDEDPDPSTLIEKAGTFVSMIFADLDPGAEEGTEGDRETVRSGAVLVRVQAPENLREQILATLHRISTDANGCPVTDPIAADPARRPDAPVSVIELKGITSVAACRYSIPGGQFANPPEDDDFSEEDFSEEDFSDEDFSEEDFSEEDFSDEDFLVDPEGDPEDVPLDSDEELIDEDLDDPLIEDIEPGANLRPTTAPLLPAGTPATAPTLLSSVLLSGDAARDAVRAIAQSRVGTGPDSEGGCEGKDADAVRGTEEIVLRVSTTAGASQIYLRYGGCHNGFDDGFTERMLTRVAVAPFVSGSNLVPSYGVELLRILDDPNAPATSGDAEEGAASPEPDE